MEYIKGHWELPQENKQTNKQTKTNALGLLAVDVGGKNTQEWDQIRIWAAPEQAQGSAQC